MAYYCVPVHTYVHFCISCHPTALHSATVPQDSLQSCSQAVTPHELCICLHSASEDFCSCYSSLSRSLWAAVLWSSEEGSSFHHPVHWMKTLNNNCLNISSWGLPYLSASHTFKIDQSSWTLQYSQSFTPLTIHHLGHNYQFVFKDAMGHPVKSCAKVKHIHSQLLCQSFQHRRESGSSGMICPPLLVWLGSPSLLLIFLVSGNDFQENSFHGPPQEWCKADWSAVLWIFHLICFKNSCNICSFLIIKNFQWLWKTNPCPPHSQALIQKIHSSSLADSPWPADLRKTSTVSP